MSFDLSKFCSTELMKTAKGGNKESIYKVNAFEGLDVDAKKHLRVKFRKLMLNYCESVIAITDKNKLAKLAKDFNDFYTEVYKVNDFSLTSICSANTNDTKKEVYKNGIEKFAKLLKKNQQISK